jgi:hypothetical protein
MVEALDQAGLRELAPSLVGDYFPDKSPKQLPRKADVCQRAKPQQHSHFFTDDGQFGSLDQHEQQVDDAPYSVIDDRALRLSPEFGEETYRYRIVAGNELTLEPIIPTAPSTRRSRTRSSSVWPGTRPQSPTPGTPGSGSNAPGGARDITAASRHEE